MLAALVASSALGYAPMMQPLRAARSCAVSMAVSDMPGISTETGNVVWDPMGLSENMDDANLKLVRAAELKHGRVCMLATVGWVATDLGFVLPGETHQVSALQAHDIQVDAGAMTQIGIWLACLECVGFLAILEMLDGSGRKPGNFGFDPLQIGGADDPDMQLKEIENGRLAMIAFAGIVTQSALTGKGFPYF